MKDWAVTKLCFEHDTEPYALKRDAAMKEAAEQAGVEVANPVGHTLYDSAALIERNGGKPPLTYKAFEKLMKDVGAPAAPLIDAPHQLPPVHAAAGMADTGVPTTAELGYDGAATTTLKGGETEALSRLAQQLSDKQWVADFEKPKGDPALFDPPATTVLSPYLKFGCISPRLFYSQLIQIYKVQSKYTKPPVSLEGQLLWREFFYTVGAGTQNFDQMVGNPICKQIDWDESEEHYHAWEAGKTGHPWIDAIMRQLNEIGWMHHLARHSVACFLTRGDLYISWERGRDTFDRLLIDGDHFINNGNWMWLSCSAFFNQYYRVYSPTAFPKKYAYEPYIRRFVPELKDMPKQYLLEPWKAPEAVQKKARCIIGKDYPAPIVEHNAVYKENILRIKAAYDADKLSAKRKATS
jgi:cryptochrome